MRKLFALARSGAARRGVDVVQLAGVAGVSWGLWDVAPWAGKVAAGLGVLLFGVAAERAKGGA